MKNWRNYLGRGDVAKACREAGVTTTVYYESVKIPKGKWTIAQFRVNAKLMEMAEVNARARKKVMNSKNNYEP